MMLGDNGTWVLVVGGILLAAGAVYVVGYIFSMGYHQGKREFIARMVRDNCGDSDKETH